MAVETNSETPSPGNNAVVAPHEIHTNIATKIAIVVQDFTVVPPMRHQKSHIDKGQVLLFRKYQTTKRINPESIVERAMINATSGFVYGLG